LASPVLNTCNTFFGMLVVFKGEKTIMYTDFAVDFSLLYC